MAGIGRGANKAEKKTETIEQLMVKIDEHAGNIRKIVNKRADNTSFSEEERAKLRVEYSKAAQIARQIVQRATDDETREKYEKLYKRFSERAEQYGSAMESKIPDTTFEDVKGLDNVKKLVKSFLYMAQNPDVVKYYKIEGGLGIMMYGAPGTGKTMFAEAVANAMQLPMFTITPAKIFKSYVGQSEQMVKQIFDDIEACPDGAVLFVDECESIFSKRTEDTKDYKSAVTNELLQRINGFGKDGSKRIMIAATNRPEMIDPAYLRFKRFTYLVHVTPPDLEAKRAIISSKLEGIELADVTVEDVLMMTEKMTTRETAIGRVAVREAYYSAADICGIIEETCRTALEQLQEKGLSTPIPLTRAMFENAFQKIPPSISAELLKTYEDFRK